MKRLLLLPILILVAIPASAQMSSSTTGSGINQIVTVTSAGQFKLVFEAYSNWGLTQWYDLVNDPTAATNLALAYSVSGPGNACAKESGLQQMTFYGAADAKLFIATAGCSFSGATRSLTILSSSSAMVAIQTSGSPMDIAGPDNFTNITGTMTYYIYPTGKIYVTAAVHVTNAQDLSNGQTAGLYFSFMGLNNPAGGISTTPDNKNGWVRATNSANPYAGAGDVNPAYLFAYWDATTPTYGTFTKASIMEAISSTRPSGASFTEIIHGWSCGTGCGTTRWGYQFIISGGQLNVAAGATLTQDFFMQLGTQGSSLLPNITTTTPAGPLATEYQTPPTMTPVNATGGAFVETNGYWTMARTSDNVSMTANGILHKPAWLISNWSASSVALTVNGVSQTLNTNYYTYKTDSTHVLVVYLGDVASTNVVIFAPSSGGGGSPVVVLPANPAVRQGGTQTFTEQASDVGTWSCSGTDSTGMATTCAGSINASTGVYTAPASVTAKQSIAGFQLLPNNHIFNTRIDSLSVNTNNATWMSGITLNPSYAADVPINYFSSAPLVPFVFYSTSSSNGSYQTPAYPDVLVEGGFLSAQNNINGPDHYFLSAIESTNTVQEIYGYLLPGFYTGLGCPTCNSGSGFAYSNSTYLLPTSSPNQAINAAGTFLTPLMLRLQEMEQAVASGGKINHALKNTFSVGNICNCFIWPATNNAADTPAKAPFGARSRLKSTYDCTAHGLSAIALILCTQLKEQGLVATDGGTNWSIEVELARWPDAYMTAFAQIAALNLASNMEFVDESSLMLSSTSGECVCNREIITFTRTSDSATGSTDVVLTGVTVNLPQDTLYIQAGTPAQQLTALVGGGATNTVTWSVSPAITGGSLTSGGLLTIPASIGTATAYTITATSVDNAAIAAQETLTIFPTGVIGILPGSTADFTDSLGHVFYHRTGITGGLDTLGCCATSGEGNFSGTDKQLYWDIYYTGLANADLHISFLVPAGNYQIKYRQGTIRTVGQQLNTFNLQGTDVATNVDMSAVAGGQYKFYTLTASKVVTSNNILKFAGFEKTDGQVSSISSFEIDPLPSGGTGSQIKGNAAMSGGIQ